MVIERKTKTKKLWIFPEESHALFRKQQMSLSY